MDSFDDLFASINPFQPTESITELDIVNQSDEDFIVPDDCILNVEYVEGKKEGPGTIRTKKGILFAKVNYENDRLNGYCIFNDYDGKKRFEGYYENGVRDGWGCEYDEKHKPIFTGIYRNGEKYCEMKPVTNMKEYFQEIVNGKVIAVCKYTKNYSRTGICYLYENEKICRISKFQEGLEMKTVKEFDNDIMKEYNGNGMLIYEGGFKDDLANGYPREGKGDEYDNNGFITYSGNWKKNQLYGSGNSYKDGSLYYSGNWKQGAPSGYGEVMNENGDIVFKGTWSVGILSIGNKKIDYKTGKEIIPPK